MSGDLHAAGRKKQGKTKRLKKTREQNGEKWHHLLYWSGILSRLPTVAKKKQGEVG